ncbi:DinB family protein [Paenibacillus oleatilyticus]|uniref:DinB family protein n=1 Tax=Paenibacillus oleatilyticus TaxID=2594886 RepID=UPI001C1F4C3D|nr:DinB family protein [Paenibacillus oleatilyticus]MBU7319963.1 DinB family protein [Paenibacillus oleatilyticus]
MNTTEVLRNFEEITEHYIQELEGFSMEQLKRQPGENEWSLGQMYQHLINAALYMQLANAERCLTPAGDDAVSAGEKTEVGEAVFEQGGLPPVRIQVPPSPQYTPQEPESKEQLVEGLSSVVRHMNEIALKLENAPLHHTVAHPRFGGLTAEEWFRLVEMHYRHHLLQKDRLKQVLAPSV